MKRCKKHKWVRVRSASRPYACGRCGYWPQKPPTNQKIRDSQLDRKNSKIGYTKDNCVVCCTLCNSTKGNRFTYEQFVEIGKLIRGFRATTP